MSKHNASPDNITPSTENYSTLLSLTYDTWKHLSMMILIYSLVGIIGYTLYFLLFALVLKSYYLLALVAFIPFALLEIISMGGVVLLTSAMTKTHEKWTKETKALQDLLGTDRDVYKAELSFAIMYAGVFAALRMVALIAIAFVIASL